MMIGRWFLWWRLLLMWWLVAPGLAAWAGDTRPPVLHLADAQFAMTDGGTWALLGPDVEVPAAVQWESMRESVALPHKRRRTTTSSDAGDVLHTAWYRWEISRGLEQVPMGQLYFYLPRWQTVGQVALFADDELLYRSAASPVWNGFNHPLWQLLDRPGHERPRTVWLRLDYQESAGLSVSTAWLGDKADLNARRAWREWLQADLPRALSQAFLVLGFLALGVWALRREPAYLLFSVSTVLFLLRALHYHQGLEPPPIPDDWYGWMTIYSTAWMVPAVYAIGVRLHGKSYPWGEWPLVLLLLVSTVISIPSLAGDSREGHNAATPLAYLLLFSTQIGLVVLGVWSAWRARSNDALLVASSLLLGIPASVNDLLMLNHAVTPEGLYLQPYHIGLVFITCLVVAVRRYLAALRNSEHAAAGLEQQLREREAALNESHAQLRAIERDQVLMQERQRLMQDMHDGLGTTLMGALKAVERGQEQNLAEVLRECIEDLKLAIDSLEPVQTDLLLLLATLRFRLGTRLEQAGLRLQWKVQDLPPMEWIDPRSALHLLRILQEVMGNAMRHSGATELTVATRLEAACAVVMVQDNGRGFDPASVDRRGRGLRHVQQRAEALGAKAIWRAVDGTSATGGTQFELWLPLERPSS